jgi:hypothetical protein
LALFVFFVFKKDNACGRRLACRYAHHAGGTSARAGGIGYTRPAHDDPSTSA